MYDLILNSHHKDTFMLKNIFATIGLLVVMKKGYDFYCKYQDMKQENEFYKRHENKNSYPE